MNERSIPEMAVLLDILFCEEKCISFLFEKGVLVNLEVCLECDGRVSRGCLRFRCTRYTCQKSVSIFQKTFFSGGRIKCNEVLHLGYLWLTNCTSTTTLQHTKHSSSTISTYRNFFRQLVCGMLDPDDIIIGVPDIIVQVDETKIGKRKYHRGHRVEGAWVIVGVELTGERLVFAEVVEDRSEATILNVLRRHIAEGSIIRTDYWRGYSSISRVFNIRHETVNHSQFFTDPETGVNTNTVEGTNFAIKSSIPIRNRVKEDIPGFLGEFAWRRKNKFNLWEAFIRALKETEYLV